MCNTLLFLSKQLQICKQTFFLGVSECNIKVYICISNYYFILILMHNLAEGLKSHGHSFAAMIP